MIKRKVTMTLILVSLSMQLVSAADVVAEFGSGNEGWSIISHVRSNAPLTDLGITARNQSPAANNGFLQVQDLNGDWNWIVAPSNFLGNWSRFAEIKMGFVTDDYITIHPLVLLLSGSHDGVTTNTAQFAFPIAGTPGSSRLEITSPIIDTNWVVVSGTWSNLISNVQQFLIRVDLNDNVASELDLFDYVRLIDSDVQELRIYRAVELEFFSVAGLMHQLQISTDMVRWRNFGLPFIGNGTQQTKCVRVGDQEQAYFKMVRTP